MKTPIALLLFNSNVNIVFQFGGYGWRTINFYSFFSLLRDFLKTDNFLSIIIIVHYFILCNINNVIDMTVSAHPNVRTACTVRSRTYFFLFTLALFGRFLRTGKLTVIVLFNQFPLIMWTSDPTRRVFWCCLQFVSLADWILSILIGSV